MEEGLPLNDIVPTGTREYKTQIGTRRTDTFRSR